MSQLRNILMTQQGGGSLPYTPLEHCYFDGAAVSLGFKLTNTITSLKVSFTGKNSNWIFGSRDYQTSSDRFTLQVGTGTAVATNNISATTTTNIGNINSRIDYSYDGSTITIQNNSNTYTSSNTRGFPNGNRVVMLGSIRNGSTIQTANCLEGYFWGLEVEVNNVLAQKIIPVKDLSNVVCLYNTVTSEFLYSTIGTLLENP